MWKKDYPTMLRAMARQSAAVLLIAGDGPQRAELESLAHDLGANVRFLGPRSDIPELMNASDGLVLSSVVEGLPVVLLEAAASGLPCVATDAGGVREAISDSSYVVPPHDPDALAESMARLSSLPSDSRARMSQLAHAHAVSHFDQRVITTHWEQLYRLLTS
jgi:glycosyltransferase involved in cell wall biosynthesis